KTSISNSINRVRFIPSPTINTVTAFVITVLAVASALSIAGGYASYLPMAAAYFGFGGETLAALLLFSYFALRKKKPVLPITQKNEAIDTLPPPPAKPKETSLSPPPSTALIPSQTPNPPHATFNGALSKPRGTAYEPPPKAEKGVLP